MSNKRYRRLLYIIPLVIFFGAFYFVSPEQIVNAVGVENSYVFMFLIALLWGLSFFSGVPYPAILLTFALGGLDPLLLGVSAAMWVMIGDSTTYFLWRKSDIVFPKHLQNGIDKILWMYDRYPNYIPLLFFIYGVCIPLPNDIITFSAWLKKYSFFKSVLPLWIGNVIFCIVLAYFSVFFSTYYL